MNPTSVISLHVSPLPLPIKPTHHRSYYNSLYPQSITFSFFIHESPPPMADQSHRDRDQQINVHHQQQDQYGQQHQSPSDTFKSMFSQEGRKGPSSSKILAIAAVLPFGGFLLLLSGITLTVTITGLAVLSPAFALFSPVLIPAAMVIGLAVAGFLSAGAFGITALSSLSWMANNLRRIGAKVPEQLEQAKRRMQDTAGSLGQKSKETAQAIESNAQEGETKGEQEGGKKVEGGGSGGKAQEGGKGRTEGAKAQEGGKS